MYFFEPPEVVVQKKYKLRDMLKIDLDIARRFILGKQGLWHGRRRQAGCTGGRRAAAAPEISEPGMDQCVKFCALSRMKWLTLKSRWLFKS
jgi:hypothetical protein